MEIENILKMFSPEIDNFERIGGEIEFPDKKVEDIVNTVIKISTIPLSKETILKKFYISSGIEKYIIDDIYLVLGEVIKGTFGHIYQEGCEWNPGADLSALYWTVFGKEKYSNNLIISNLYKALEFMFWNKREKTVSEIMGDLEEITADYNFG
jgi:hypothetical protein